MALSREVEIERNYQVFESQYLNELLAKHEGQFVLIKDERIIKLCGTLVEAIIFGHEKYGDEPYSVQEVTAAPLDLGFFSHANAQG